MAFTPAAPFPKTQGDIIRSSDWNDLAVETQRLDNDKINKAGDAMAGPLTIDGNVGIGTTNPRGKLDIKDGNDKNVVISGWDPGSIGGVSFNAHNDPNNAHVPMTFAANRFYFHAGNVGIGMTNPGNYRFVIKQTSSTTGRGLRIINAAGNKTAQMWVGTGGAVLDAEGTTNLHLRTGGQDRLFIHNDGRVGIGTASPKATLHVAGELLGAAKDTAGKALRICTGSTKKGNTNWKVYSASGVYVDVNTTACKFKKTPIYITSLHGTSSHWFTTGGSSVYLPTKNGFRIYVRFADDRALTPANANQMKWHIQWVAIGE